ncbi:MAG: hypothetical protein OIF38_19085, partial [Cellvibrionaceae bacterium]|nr:hypothetical protein [Cellvibrionaceae bacterium]
MRILFILSLAICLISFVKRNEIPSNIRLHSGVLQEPSQTPSYKSPFSVKLAERQYKIKPLYNYDLYGLVVSYRHHDGDKMLHKAWGDHINVADVCVVWSKTAQSPWLNKLNFWNR